MSNPIRKSIVKKISDVANTYGYDVHRNGKSVQHDDVLYLENKNQHHEQHLIIIDYGKGGYVWSPEMPKSYTIIVNGEMVQVNLIADLINEINQPFNSGLVK
ncbi:MAG: hypothetical protein KJ906_00475 [Nanoarchaeota archaeon]|nr:hypothetical protein [Nanoarchaeota archaeon]